MPASYINLPPVAPKISSVGPFPLRCFRFFRGQNKHRGDTHYVRRKTLVCKDCGKEFVWTAGEQEFYASRGFENQPQRCKPCRDARKNATRGERQMFDATCASCGKACKVPFQPREDRPVYCSECFAKMKENG